MKRPNRHAHAAGFALSAALVLWGGAAHAADPSNGRRLARACAPCHGVNGVSALPEAPSIASHPFVYTVRQLRAYRAGDRHHEVMSIIAKDLSDQDIDDLAAWYASIEIEAILPPR